SGHVSFLGIRLRRARAVPHDVARVCLGGAAQLRGGRRRAARAARASASEAAAAVKQRIAVLALLVTAFFVVLICRLAATQLRDGGYYAYLANLNQLRTIPVAAPRGLLYDRNGLVIARNRPSFVVQAVPMQLRDPAGEIRELAAILGVPQAALWQRLLRQNGVTYASFDDLAAAVPLGPVTIADDLSTATVGRFAERADRLP